MLKARINELEDEMKEMKENQAVILQFMANYKKQNPNGEFSNVLNSTKTEVIIKDSILYINVWRYNFHVLMINDFRLLMIRLVLIITVLMETQQHLVQVKIKTQVLIYFNPLIIILFA